MKKKKTPQLKKEESYKKDRRNSYGESPHGSRSSIPENKARVNRDFRRKTKGALKIRRDEVDTLDKDSIENSAKVIQREKWKKHADIPLGEMLAIKKERKERVARKQKSNVDPSLSDTGLRRIMFIENKSAGSGLDGPARIGWVTLSKSKRSYHYAGRTLKKVRDGYKYNCVDEQSGDHYWVSGPKARGGDKLYGGVVEIDEDAREEYWVNFRRLPNKKAEPRYRG